MIKSSEEKLQEAWLQYFKNIEKENDLISALLGYFKELEIKINEIEQNTKKRKNEEYESNKKFKSKSENENKIKSILPEYVQCINKKELRKYLSEATNRINEFKLKVDKSEIYVSLDFRKKIEHFYKLLEKINLFQEETQKSKPIVDKNKFTSLCINNFKGFSEENDKNDNTINIKPITLIYGPNSYGKSSIFQTLLLLNQTVREGEDYNNVTLLENGTLVKLGRFEDFINKNDKEKELQIEVSLPYNQYLDNDNDMQNNSILTELSCCYHFGLIKEREYLTKIDIYARQIDYTDTKRPIKSLKKLLYTLKLNKENNTYEITKHHNECDDIDDIIIKNFNINQELKKTSFLKLEEFLPETPFNQIQETLRGLIYVSSFRIPPERYYVPENNTRIYVGKNGEHTAEILSYDKEVDNNVNYWLGKIAGYKLSFKDSKKASNNKVNSINLNDEKTSLNEINLIDLGSGIAQVLPIITQAFKSENDMILIEEPEIHLHPKAQAELGGMFADAMNKKNNTFIIETHSENLLLRLERLIRKGELSKDDVSIIYVNKDRNGSHCIPLILDDDGDITNIDKVPNGFFDEGFDELFDIDKE